MNRRGFLTGLLASPAVITTPGLLMPVKAWSEAWPVDYSSLSLGLALAKLEGLERVRLQCSEIMTLRPTVENIRQYRRAAIRFVQAEEHVRKIRLAHAPRP